MAEAIRAERAQVRLGSLEIDGYRLPDDSYRMSMNQAGQCVGKTAQGVSNFLKSKALKSLLGESGGVSRFLPDAIANRLSDGYQPESITAAAGSGSTRFNGLPLEMVSMYWMWEAFRGNKRAFYLAVALSTETLTRRFDAAFGVSRDEQEYQDRLAIQLKISEQLESELADSYAWVDVKDEWIRRLEEQVRELGGEPWQRPGDDET